MINLLQTFISNQVLSFQILSFSALKNHFPDYYYHLSPPKCTIKGWKFIFWNSRAIAPLAPSPLCLVFHITQASDHALRQRGAYRTHLSGVPLAVRSNHRSKARSLSLSGGPRHPLPLKPAGLFHTAFRQRAVFSKLERFHWALATRPSVRP